ncbi:MAG TPA: type VI secretion system tip protein TssI/VgrG, partial [Nannocystis sp.]
MPTATDLWDTVTRSHKPLPSVRYSFRVEGWRGALWHVRRVELVEALSEPYRLTVELVVDEPRLDLDELLGDVCALELDRKTSTRTVHGVVLSATDLGRSAGRHHVRLEVGPALALLAQRVDTRAWQDRNAPDILKDVLSGPLAELGRTINLDALRVGDYPRREYCVQFRESDLAFAERLMQEEGITYYFDHSGEAEKLILIDDNHDFAALQGDNPIAIRETEPDTAAAESVQRFSFGRRMRSSAVAQRNFDWQSPQSPRASARNGTDHRGRTREVYEHDDIVYPGDGERLAKLKQERLDVGAHAASGESNVTGLYPGAWFSLQGHARAELDDKYLVTKVIHKGEAPDVNIMVTQASAGPPYVNEFEVIPLKVPYRPMKSQQKPKVSGLQTATVTGPPGEEVHCDEHGRIKILPHWDRMSPQDETSSWWVRCAQALAGSGWGFFALPRIGMEVVVDFLDGDPDRPLVVGCVYNGQNQPPYPLPAEKTKTTLK